MNVQATNSSIHTPNTSPVILEVPSNSNVNGQVQTCSHNKKIGIDGNAGALLGGALPLYFFKDKTWRILPLHFHLPMDLVYL